MRPLLQKELFTVAPHLFLQASVAPDWKIDAPDDLYPFILELAESVEKFNCRYARRRVRALKISVDEGVLTCVYSRRVPCIEKRTAAARRAIRLHRRELRANLLERAKKIQSTALFASRLLPDWRRLMPDERSTLRTILDHAERCAVSSDDWQCLANWYRTLLRDRENADRCAANGSNS